MVALAGLSWKTRARPRQSLFSFRRIECALQYTDGLAIAHAGRVERGYTVGRTLRLVSAAGFRVAARTGFLPYL